MLLPPPPPYDCNELCREIVEEIVAFTPVVEKERVSLMEAVDYENMIAGATRWAKEIEPDSDSWVRVNAHSTEGRYAAVTKNTRFGARIEYYDESSMNASGQIVRVGKSTSLGHLEMQARLQLAHSDNDDEGASAIGGYTIGAGITTGAGIKDDSVSVKALGCGLSVGRKMSISLFDNEVSVDLGHLYNRSREALAAAETEGGTAADAVVVTKQEGSSSEDWGSRLFRQGSEALVGALSGLDAIVATAGSSPTDTKEAQAPAALTDTSRIEARAALLRTRGSSA